MTSYISRHRFIPLPDGPAFVQATHEEYQANRSHPERPIKVQHPSTYMEPVDTINNVSFVRRHTARDQNLRSFILSPEKQVKRVGFIIDNTPPATTGTSQLNTVCFTDDLHVCCGVAIGGEKITDSAHLPKAKIRIFHAFPLNTNIVETISTYVEQLLKDGYTVKAAAMGGRSNDPSSVELAGNLRTMLSRLNVSVEFDEMCEKRDNTPSTLLGAVIRDDHSVQFITKLGIPVPDDHPVDTPIGALPHQSNDIPSAMFDTLDFMCIPHSATAGKVSGQISSAETGVVHLYTNAFNALVEAVQSKQQAIWNDNFSVGLLQRTIPVSPDLQTMEANVSGMFSSREDGFTLTTMATAVPSLAKLYLLGEYIPGQELTHAYAELEKNDPASSRLTFEVLDSLNAVYPLTANLLPNGTAQHEWTLDSPHFGPIWTTAVFNTNGELLGLAISPMASTETKFIGQMPNVHF